MRGRHWLLVSLGLNVLLAALALALYHQPSPPTPPPASLPASPSPSNPPPRTQVVVRRENFVWSDIESEDYATYITNLRAIGCPESTIRDIIVAEINQLFARRRATEVVSAEQQWWRSDPDPAVTLAAAEKLRSLEQERRELLARLLGPEWASSMYPFPDSPGENPLDGPLLGNLTPRQAHAVHEIEDRLNARLNAYLGSLRDGTSPSQARLEQLRREARAELAAVLSPDQLEEYLLRYSPAGDQLRAELRGLNVTPEEFRALFRARDAVELELKQLADSTDPAAARRRRELEQQREATITQAFGNERYQAYQLNLDPLYRSSRDLVERIGSAPEKLLPLYEINQTTALEQQRIRNDPALTPEQRTEALHAVQASRENTLRRLFGPEIYERYLQEQSQ